MKVLFILSVAILAALARKHPHHQRPHVPLAISRLHHRIHYAGVCGYNPPEVQLHNVTIVNSGTMVNVFFSFTRQINIIEKSIVTIRRCNSPEDKYSCEHFHIWRFGTESCTFVEMKNQVWSGIFQAVHPPIKCPMKKGDYRFENATIDTESILGVFTSYPIEKYFWRVQIDGYDHKLFTCIVFGLEFYR